MGLIHVLKFPHTEDRRVTNEGRQRFVIETDSKSRIDLLSDFHTNSVNLSLESLHNLTETERKLKYTNEELNTRGYAVSGISLRKHIVKLVGFGDRIKWGSTENLHVIRNTILQTIKDMKWEFCDVSLLIDGDWLKRKSITLMAYLLAEMEPSLEVNIVRTTENSHLNYMHSTQEYDKSDDANDLLYGEKMTWMDAYQTVNINVWHIPPLDSEGPSGTRNLLIADLVVVLGAGEETERELQILGCANTPSP